MRQNQIFDFMLNHFEKKIYGKVYWELCRCKHLGCIKRPINETHVRTRAISKHRLGVFPTYTYRRTNVSDRIVCR